MTALKPLHKRLDGEEGVVVVIFALVLVVLFAAVAFAVDLSRLYHQRQVLQNAVDFGALAGAQELPVQGTAQASTAAAEALKVTLANAPEIAPSQVAISFRCIVGDRDGNGAPDVEDIPAVCGPSLRHVARGGVAHEARSFLACVQPLRRGQVQHDPRGHERDRGLCVRPRDRHQQRIDGGAERRVLQGCVRRRLRSARRRPGARPNREHDRRPTS